MTTTPPPAGSDALLNLRTEINRLIDAAIQAGRPNPAFPTVVIDGLEWSPTLNDGERMNYADAEKACAALGDGWRLPTRAELQSILDLTRHDPAIDTAKFPDTKSGWYWSSTPCAWAPSCAWCVVFYSGYVYGNHRDFDAFARAVRAVPAGQ